MTLWISSAEPSGLVPGMFIGNNYVFEVDCVIDSKKIGDNNIVESIGIKCIRYCNASCQFSISAFVGKQTALSFRPIIVESENQQMFLKTIYFLSIEFVRMYTKTVDCMFLNDCVDKISKKLSNISLKFTQIRINILKRNLHRNLDIPTGLPGLVVRPQSKLWWKWDRQDTKDCQLNSKTQVVTIQNCVLKWGNLAGKCQESAVIFGSIIE